ncbi:hypothetical protein FAI41_06630 [Acetobacteraceae bacterium]|nr:hypothetical protein FAI41_06630 [Acetobacteraceae bacterium]
MNFTNILLLAGAMAGFQISPGVAILLIAKSGLAGRERYAYGAALGVISSGSLWTILSVEGLAVLLYKDALIYHCLEAAAAFWMFYLAYRAFFATHQLLMTDGEFQGRNTILYGLRAGFLADVTDVQNAIFFAIMFPMFSHHVTALLVVLVVGLMSGFVFGGTAFLSCKLSSKVQKYIYLIECCSGFVFTAFGIALLISLIFYS